MLINLRTRINGARVCVAAHVELLSFPSGFLLLLRHPTTAFNENLYIWVIEIMILASSSRVLTLECLPMNVR